MPILTVDELRIKLFADGADFESLQQWAAQSFIKGITTNPTLMRTSGVRYYEKFCRDLIQAVPDKPISFTVLSDEPSEIRREALMIHDWSQNNYIKVPITDTRGGTLLPVVRDLTESGVKVNVTAVFSLRQVEDACQALRGGASSIVSIFAGRIADSGRDPVPHMREALSICRASDPVIELLWASPRELLNVVQADAVGADIITVVPDLLCKLPLLGKDLETFSLETVRMFNRDARSAGYTL